MKKVLLVVCAMLLACSSMTMAELVGDDVQFDILFSDESPYAAGERVRVSALVVNGNNAYQPIRLIWQMMDPLGNASTGTIQRNVYPYFSGTLSFGKPLPQGAFPGLYTWTGLMMSKEADLSWQAVGQKQISFTVGEEGSSGPSSPLAFYCSLFPQDFAQGESFTMDALVSNGTENGVTIQVQAYITTPGGGERLLGPHTLDVGAADNVSHRVSVLSPGDAPAGAYSVAQQLVDMDGEVLSEVLSSFTITGASFAMLQGDALLALAAIPEENKLDPEYNVAADLDNIMTLFNASDVQGALDQAQAIITYLPEKYTTAGEFAPALDTLVDYLEASLNTNFTYSLI